MQWLRGPQDQGSNDVRRSQVAELEMRALSLFRQGRTAEAVPLQERAVELVHAVIDAQAGAIPDDLLMLGSLQYGLGSSLRAVGRPDDALAALGAAEGAYQELLDSGRRDMVQRIADVQVRRARALQELGRVTDSMLEMDRAVQAMLASRPHGDGFEHEMGLSRLLFTNAMVLSKYGDPDLVLSSADAAVRLIMSNGLRVNTLGDDSDYYVDVLRSAATIAMREHAGQGRAEIAAAAGEIAIGTWTEADQSEFPSLTGEMRALPPMYRTSITRAAAYYGKLTDTLGQPDLSARYLDFARGLDPGVADTAEREWPGIANGPVSMAAAMHQARALLGSEHVPDEVLLLGGSDDTHGEYTTGQRCPQAQWAASARQLARIVAPLEQHPKLVSRIGFEAHVLYASSLAAAKAVTAWHLAHARDWMLLIQDLIRSFEHAADEAMCQELSRWMDVTNTVVNPFYDPHGH